MHSLLPHFEKDIANKKLFVTRTFKAPLPLVWRTWTEAELLEKWWAPRPYLAITRFLDFCEGGYWLYYMLSPEGEKHWCRADYLTIAPHDNFTALDAFCDEAGEINTAHPRMHWKNTFREKDDQTTVLVEITFESSADLEKIIEMGFKDGFTLALTNLNELLEQGI